MLTEACPNDQKYLLNVWPFSIVCSSLLFFEKDLKNIIHISKSKPNKSRMNTATSLNFCLKLAQVFKSVCWKFGDFSMVCSIFIKVHKTAQKYNRKYRSSHRWPNNSRRKQAAALKFSLWLLQVITMILVKFSGFSIVWSLFIKIGTPLHRFFCLM